MAFIKEPERPGWLLWLIEKVERRIGKKMMPARLLLWHPKAFIGSMVLEGLVAHKDPVLTERMLKLIRMQVSLRIACPFCVDMNCADFDHYRITSEEIKAMQGQKRVKEVASFSFEERLILYYARSLTRTPIKLHPRLVRRMKIAFGEREFAVIVTTIAQVDYWTRIIQGFGIEPVGFLDQCQRKYFD